MIFALAALFPLGRRISAEQKQRKVAVIMTLEEIKELSEISDTPESEWMKALSNAGLSAVMVKESDLSDGAIMKNIKTMTVRFDLGADSIVWMEVISVIEP